MLRDRLYDALLGVAARRPRSFSKSGMITFDATNGLINSSTQSPQLYLPW